MRSLSILTLSCAMMMMVGGQPEVYLVEVANTESENLAEEEVGGIVEEMRRRVCMFFVNVCSCIIVKEIMSICFIS